jgi:hypothetical protein
MSDDFERKKTFREEVEEYKRRQRAEEEAKASKSDGDAKSADDDEDEDEDEDEGLEDDEAEMNERGSGVDLAAGGRGPNVVKIVSTVFLAVGIVLLLISAGTFWSTRQSVAAEVTAKGVVVKNVVRAYTTRASNSSIETTSDYYYPVVEFPLADGTRKTVEMSQGSWPKAYDEGETVTVRYNPEKPLRARLGGGSAMDFLASLITGFLGAVFTSIAIGVRRAFA